MKRDITAAVRSGFTKSRQKLVQAIEVKGSRAGTSTNDDRSIVYSRDLPPDLIFPILVSLFQPIYEGIFASHYYTLTHPHGYQKSLSQKALAAISPLYNVTLVSRVWRLVGTELLYAGLFLTSPENLLAFARTLKQRPNYARYIRDIYILNDSLGDGRRGSKPLSARKLKALRSAFAEVISACPTLDSLILNNANAPDSHIFPPTSITHVASLGSRLRVLTLCKLLPGGVVGDANPSMRLNLPMLEILCLRGAEIMERDGFPLMPRLQTLQLIKCNAPILFNHFLPDRSIHLILPCTPNLDTLELYENRSKIIIDPELAERLTTVHLVGSLVERDLFIHWDAMPALLSHPRVQSLALGLTIDKWDEIGGEPPMVFPGSLKDLTLLFFVPTGETLGVWCDCVMCGFRREQLDLLESLEILFGPHVGYELSEEEQSLVNSIQEACEERNVSFVTNFDGM